VVIARDGWTKPLLILCGIDEGAYHASVVARHSVIENIQPEIIPALVRVAPEIAEILCQNERGIEFGLLENGVVSDHTQHARARLSDWLPDCKHQSTLRAGA